MKTVLILRHAKSDWGDPSLRDFDRPLAKRGRKDAPRMGAVLRQFDVVPDKILSSPAKRAKQTAKTVAETAGYTEAIEWRESFYGGGSRDLLAALQALPDTVESAMLVGHNPILEETVAGLLLDENAGWGGMLDLKLPTAGLVCLDFDIFDWSDVAAGRGRLRWFIIPRLVKAIT